MRWVAHVCHYLCVFLIQLVWLQVVGTVSLPIIHDPLCYSFDVSDVDGDVRTVMINIDGSNSDWLEQCTIATRELLPNVGHFICAQVSLGVLRKERPILRQ